LFFGARIATVTPIDLVASIARDAELALLDATDAKAKKQGLSPAARLKLHQDESGPVMKEIKEWMDKLVTQKLVEPNPGLGSAISYMTDRWDALTRFLHLESAPLDNNTVESALKKVIRLRKRSMFITYPAAQLQADYDHVWGGECISRSNARTLYRRCVVEPFGEPPAKTRIFYHVDWGFTIDATAMVCFWVTKHRGPSFDKDGKPITIEWQELWISDEAFGHSVRSVSMRPRGCTATTSRPSRHSGAWPRHRLAPEPTVETASSACQPPCLPDEFSVASFLSAPPPLRPSTWRARASAIAQDRDAPGTPYACRMPLLDPGP
jgi:hypothetical protein